MVGLIRIVCFQTVVSPCPLPDLLSNPNNRDAAPRLVGVTGSIDRPENPPLAAGDYLNAGTVLKVVVSLKYPLDTAPLQSTEVQEVRLQIGFMCSLSANTQGYVHGNQIPLGRIAD